MTLTTPPACHSHSVGTRSSSTGLFRRFEGHKAVMTAVLIGLIVVPWVADPYTVVTLSRILAFAILVMSVQLISSCGLIALGQAAYFGVGAYTAALTAMNVTTSGLVQLVFAGLVAAAFAAVTGGVAVRARGSTFILITIAVGQLTYAGAVYWREVTGGTDGLPGVPAMVPFPGTAPLVLDGWIYYWTLAVTAVTFAVLTRVLNSPYGLALRSIAQNESRARATGYPVTRYLLCAYMTAGAVAGVAGAAIIVSQQFIAPDQMGFELSVLALLAVIVGGARSMTGACAGAALVLTTRDYLGALVPGHSPLLLGLLFVLSVYLIPDGLIDGAEKLLRKATRALATASRHSAAPRTTEEDDNSEHSPLTQGNSNAPGTTPAPEFVPRNPTS